MTPLQQAANLLIEHWDGCIYIEDAMTGLRKALEAEQAQAVEPHGWMIDGMSEVMSRGHAQAVQAEHQAMGGTAVAYPVYLHPTPPPAPSVTETLAAHGVKLRTEFEEKPRDDHVADAGKTMGERAGLIDCLREHASFKCIAGNERRMVLQAADMLEADGEAMSSTNLKLEKLIKIQYGPKAQQVAVPAGFALVPIEPTPAMSAAGFCVNEAEHDPAGVYRAMLAAAQGAKP